MKPRWQLCRAIEAAGGLAPASWVWLEEPPDAQPDPERAYVLTPACGEPAALARLFLHRPVRLLTHPGGPYQRCRDYMGQTPADRDWLLLVGDATGTNDWEDRPLYGMRLVLTREASQAEPLGGELERLGAAVQVCPLLEFLPPDDPAPLQTALERLEDYNWVVFTSPNGVRTFFAALQGRGDARRLAGARLACIGPGTAAALAGHGLVSDLVPERSVAESLLEALESFPMQGKRVLLARAQEARMVLPEGLRARGAEVDVIACYRTVMPEPPGALTEADRVVVMSSSSVRHLRRLSPLDLPLLCIGPVTAATARELGYSDLAQADRFDQQGVIDKLLELNSRAGARAPAD